MANKEFRPTVSQLRTFVAIAEHGHFGTAAQRLGISQPSLSQALAALEQGLGVQLIERSTRRVIVTPVGSSLLPDAQAALDGLDAFVSHARGAQGGLVGPMTLGMIPTIAPFLLPTLLRGLPDVAPQLQLRIIEEKTADLLDTLRQGGLDAALVAGPVTVPGTGEMHLFDEEFVLLTPPGHPLAGRRDLTVADLDDLDLLLLDDGHCLRDQILDLCRSASMRRDPSGAVTRAASLTTIIQCVVGGLGCTLVPLSAVAAECDRSGLSMATFAGGAAVAGREVILCHRASSGRTEDFTVIADAVVRAWEEVASRSRDVLDRQLSRG
ncbi:hydrogen peroxide-inducible genes activator [Corynebacterium terpenotabidum]|uniref:Probable hydrogen peroxide-inducible genes activator n=1 Tax=Corynebacterium terpenotabidum Y-11 TaxID=1200352 RepID=S4XK35_9CORY|nr:hydrogen peroxide-inducible genes activator [Corynebacterium terpenotabidum]AGP30918.1 LysR family transcriptional regulator [Corynebacterium terpenotabidum Y-11]